MTDDQIKAMLSDVVAEVDYDSWKIYFVKDYAEEPELIEESLDRMVEIVKKHLC